MKIRFTKQSIPLFAGALLTALYLTLACSSSSSDGNGDEADGGTPTPTPDASDSGNGGTGGTTDAGDSGTGGTGVGDSGSGGSGGTGDGGTPTTGNVEAKCVCGTTPLGGAAITLDTFSCTTAGNGVCTLTDVPEGNGKTITCTPTGHPAGSTTVDVIGGQTVPVTIEDGC